MDSCSGRFQFPVRMAGGAASRMLEDMAHGRVEALFNSSFYMETEAGLICIGNEDLEPGPLNLVTMAPAGTNWPASGLRLNESVTVHAGTIDVGNRFSFLMNNAQPWSPGPVTCWDIVDLERGIGIFCAASSNHAGPEGLGPLLIPGFRPGPEHRVCAAAEKPIAALRHWLIAAIRNPHKRVMPDAKAVRPLIGLGPGLTPSGDDFIGGMMIALHALGEAGLGQGLWQAVRHSAEDAGNPISCAHLEAASQGEGSEPIHRAISAVLKGCPHAIQNCLPAIARIGHTSGWDIMAGAVIALQSWRKARTSVVIPAKYHRAARSAGAHVYK